MRDTSFINGVSLFMIIIKKKNYFDKIMIISYYINKDEN